MEITIKEQLQTTTFQNSDDLNEAVKEEPPCNNLSDVGSIKIEACNLEELVRKNVKIEKAQLQRMICNRIKPTFVITATSNVLTNAVELFMYKLIWKIFLNALYVIMLLHKKLT